MKVSWIPDAINALTSECFKEWGVLSVCPRLIHPVVLKVAPASDVLQAGVHESMFKIFCCHNPVSPRGVDEIVKLDFGWLADSFVNCTGRTVRLIWTKQNLEDLVFFENLGSTLLGMLQENIVELGADLQEKVNYRPLKRDLRQLTTFQEAFCRKSVSFYAIRLCHPSKNTVLTSFTLELIELDRCPWLKRN